MKKSNSIIIGVIVLIVLAGAGYAIFHKSPKSAPATASNSTASTAPAVNNAVLITKTSSSVGQYLADPSGKALYTYNSDSSGVSNCSGSCLANWPAYQDTGSTTNLPTGVSTITRSDNGQVQYTYMGMPLYYFSSDSQGQVTGNGVENFTAAKPSSSATTQPTTSTQPASTPSSSSSTPSSNNSSSGSPY
jgi:predicted lipoprotein with Yx(FWY)xxD motif